MAVSNGTLGSVFEEEEVSISVATVRTCSVQYTGRVVLTISQPVGVSLLSSLQAGERLLPGVCLTRTARTDPHPWADSQLSRFAGQQSRRLAGL